MNKEKIEKGIVYVLIGIAAGILFISMGYTDNLVNSRTGYGVLNNLMQGTFIEFFNAIDWSYGMSIYFIYAIWSIPVWIIFQIFGITQPINDFLIVMLWYKLLLVVFAVWSVYLVYQIAKLVLNEEKENIILQYISSSVFVFVIFYIAQCDIMGVCFVLLGIYFGMKDEYVKFVAAFAVAITMKYFALFAFIPLVIYKGRKIFKIVLSMLGGVSLVGLTKVILSMSTGASQANASEGFYVNRHLSAFTDYAVKIQSDVNVGLLGAFFFLVCILAYLAGNENRKVSNKRMVWFTLAGYMCFCLMYSCNFYWNILMVPFFILVAHSNRKNIRANVIMEIAFFTSIIVCNIFRQDWVFMGKTAFSDLIFKDVGVFVDENLIKYFLTEVIGINIEKYIPLLYGVEYACALFFMVVNYPRKEEEHVELSFSDRNEIKIMLWIKIAIIYAFIGMALISLRKIYQENVFDGNATVAFGEDSYEKDNCQLEGELHDLGEDTWMSSEITLQILLDEKLSHDIVLSTYGYTATGDKEIELYVNEQYVGNLRKEDEAANTTTRYYQIPKEYFSEERIQIIELKAIPEPIVYQEEEYMISLYMKDIELKMLGD